MRYKSSEAGLVSLIVCMVIMIIIALISVSFAAISRREQRQALDKQLSSQAFYAAETGVNDALSGITTKTLTDNVSTCDTADQDKISSNHKLDGDVAYTCVFVDQTPTVLSDTVKQDASSIFRLSSTAPLRSLKFTWWNDRITQPQTFPMAYSVGGANLPPYNSWDGRAGPGILRVQLIQASVPNRAASAASSVDVYGFPTTSSALPYHDARDSANNGEILSGGCQPSSALPGPLREKCQITITYVNITPGAWYLRMIAIYDDVNVLVEGFDLEDGTGSNVPFQNAQATIDATAKAGDVIRRIKVYKSLLEPRTIPDYTLSVGDDLCKRVSTNPFTTYTDSALPMCQLTVP